MREFEELRETLTRRTATLANKIGEKHLSYRLLKNIKRVPMSRPLDLLMLLRVHGGPRG
jgi:hypothetical protein